MSNLARVISIENIKQAEDELRLVGVHKSGIGIMAPKAVFRAVKIKDISVTAANILKQDMLSRGGEAATSHGTIDHSSDTTDVILLGTIAQYNGLTERLKSQQFKLPRISAQIEKIINNHENYPEPILGMEFGKRTYLMGILNVTPDSFSDGGKFAGADAAVAHAREMAGDGADIIDVGGESTRPGAEEISIEEEKERILPVISQMVVGVGRDRPVHGQKFPLISIDTRKSAVADAALKAGANMINDVSGLRFDPDMAKAAAEHQAPVIIMHSKGGPKNMQDDPRYEDLISEIICFFKGSIDMALKAGIKEENIIIDPGIGFGKTTEHNMEIIRHLEEFRSLGRPICLGMSRKSFIGGILGEKDPQKRLEGSLAALALAISKKVDIIRIHDMKESRKTVLISDKVTRRKTA